MNPIQNGSGIRYDADGNKTYFNVKNGQEMKTCTTCGREYPNCAYVILYHGIKGEKLLDSETHYVHKHPGKRCIKEEDWKP